MLSDAQQVYIHLWIFFSGCCFGFGGAVTLALVQLVRLSRGDVGPD